MVFHSKNLFSSPAAPNPLRTRSRTDRTDGAYGASPPSEEAAEDPLVKEVEDAAAQGLENVFGRTFSDGGRRDVMKSCRGVSSTAVYDADDFGPHSFQ